MILSGHSRRLTTMLPSCSYVIGTQQQHSRFIPLTNSRRNISQLPAALTPFFQYASDCNLTQGIEAGMMAIHGSGLPWASTFIATGLALRLLTAPLHIYSEKLLASRTHAQSLFTHGLLKKVGEQYKVEIVQNAKTRQLELKTDNAKITSVANKALSEHVPMLLSEHNLQASRIQNLKICTVPVWIFSSFALRNVISADFHPSIPGALWVPDLLVPDPYFIIPIAVGAFGFLNIYSQRKIYPVVQKNFRTKTYDVFLASFTLFAVVIMSNLPAVIPLYWLVVSTTGMLQSQILRHPTIKKLVGIKPMPTDSRTPFRDLFFNRSKLNR
ncbi:unnamed protein product [Auanema sp. JU1783]|nr:unnamed protein product [Auanema sp. JU1783]